MLPPPNSPTAGAASERELFIGHLLRDRLDRETDLIIQRTAWVVGSQAFLFSAYAISLNSPAHPALPALASKTRLLVVLIPWVSLVSLCLLLVTIVAGVVALLRVRRYARNTDPHVLEILEVGQFVRMATLAAPLLVPVAFLATWLAMLLHR